MRMRATGCRGDRWTAEMEAERGSNQEVANSTCLQVTT